MLNGSSDKRMLKDLMKKATSQGWRVEVLRSGHLKFYPPDVNQSAVVVGGTPSDWRALKNFISMLKKSGMKLDGLDLEDEHEGVAMWMEPQNLRGEKCPR